MVVPPKCGVKSVELFANENLGGFMGLDMLRIEAGCGVVNPILYILIILPLSNRCQR